MSKFISEIKGFTPVIDQLAQEQGLITAAVYGVVWRYCQMKDQVCRASLETISERLGISYSSTLRHIKKLCGGGYLEDTTPNLRNRPHLYKDTGKASITGVVEAHLSERKTGPHLSERQSTLSERQTHSIRKTDEDSSKIQEKKEDKSVPDGTAIPFDAFIVWCTVLELDPFQVTKTVKGKECRYGKELLRAGWCLDDIAECTRALHEQEFWRDKALSLANVAKEIGPWKRRQNTKRSIRM